MSHHEAGYLPNWTGEAVRDKSARCSEDLFLSLENFLVFDNTFHVMLSEGF